MEREVGGGIGMGNTCKPMAVSFQCMTKSTTNLKKKKVKKKKRKEILTQAMPQMKLEDVKLTKLSQSQKDKHCMISLI